MTNSAPVVTPKQAGELESQLYRPKEIRNWVDRRVGADMDFILALDGHRGLGKSCLGYRLGSEGDPDYSLTKNFAFKPGKNEIKEKHMALKKKQWLNVDEGQRSFFNLSFMDPQQIGLWKYLNESRKQNVTSSFCTPDMFKLGSSLCGIVDMRIRLVARGLGVVFWPNENAVGFDKWRIKECQKIYRENTEGKRSFEINWEKEVEIYMKFPTYMGLITWDDWPKDVKEQYLELDAKAKEEVSAEESANTEQRRDYLNFGKLADFANQNGFTQTFLARYLHVSPNYLNEAIQLVRSRQRKPLTTNPDEVIE